VDGHLAQLLIATDITARKESDDLALQQQERMQFTSRLTTMGEMASSLAHELNQPLSAISNYCMGVAKRIDGNIDPALTKEILPALEKASEQAHRAGTIIQRIRGFVKRSEPQRKAANIAEIINDAVGLVEIEAHRHRLSITSEIAENLPVVDLDPVLILPKAPVNSLMLSGLFGSFQGIHEKHSDGHRTYATWYWSNPASHILGSVKIYVATELAIRQAINAYINHNGAILHHITTNHFGFASSHYQNIGIFCMVCEVTSLAIANSDSCASL
jgi:hypothetical protein